MSLKKTSRLINIITFSWIDLKTNKNYKNFKKPLVSSLNVPKSVNLNKTALFNKQLCYFILAVDTMFLQKFKPLHFKSLIISFWYTVSAFVI